MADNKQSYYCTKCGKTMAGVNFYNSKNLQKYPEGKLDVCKKCITMHVDNFNPDSYLWILQEIDVPYVPEAWNSLLVTYGKDPSKLTGVTILGRYLAKMALKEYKDYRWKDSDYLQEVHNAKIEQTMRRQGFDMQQINDVLTKSTFDLSAPVTKPPDPVEQPEETPVDPASFYSESEEDLGLTEEDKLYLRMKWGKMYKQEEWVWLEKFYNEMIESYDIQTAGHIDTLKLICKTSLKANQLIDLGDIEGYQKMSRVYDSLMKSGKFTAAQNKAESGEYVDSISELVAICEKDGFIPRYYTDGPQDKVDRVLQDFQRYTKTLVTEEMNLGELIENSIKLIQEDKEKEARVDADAANDEDILEDQLFEEDAPIQDEDFAELRRQEEANAEADEEYLEKLVNGEEE